jgi:hypothetical protein
MKQSDLKEGSFVSKDDKLFLVLKANKTFFYAIEIVKGLNPREFLDKFKSKPRSTKIEQFCEITGMFKAKYDEGYSLAEKEAIVSEKVIKSKHLSMSPCCGRQAVGIYTRKKYSGKTQCRRCGKTFNIIKLEPENWLSLSQNGGYFQVNLETLDMRLFDLEEYKRKRKEKIIEKIREDIYEEKNSNVEGSSEELRI